MRVIAGSARRLLLKTVEGLDTRPTTDRIKETLFNMLSGEIYDCRFLDLFCGSGAIGIEALSRGADSCVFVEMNGSAVSCVKDNLRTTHLEDRATVMNCDVLTALKRMEDKRAPFHIIFMDPPYHKEHERQVLSYLSESSLADENTLIIVEAAKETDMEYLSEIGFILTKCKEYKTNKHLFITRGEI